MSRRLPVTPRSQVRSALRRLWLRSRERAQALRDAGHSCEGCGVKGRAKDTKNGPRQVLHVHHLDGIDWEGLVDLIARRILHPPDRLRVLCPACHDDEHGKGACERPGGPTVASDGAAQGVARGTGTLTCCGRRWA